MYRFINLNKGLVFIGPLPPPLGGVAATNRNIQQLISSEAQIETFDTSKGEAREDLYGRKGLKTFFIQLGIVFRGCKFLISSNANIVNVFVTSNISFFRELTFLFLAKVLRKKIVIHLHTKLHGELFLSKYLIRVYFFLLSLADRIFVLSDSHKLYFSRFVSNNKLVVLENFVFDELFRPKGKREHASFLYVGRLTEKKGFYDLLDAIVLVKERFSEARFHIVGMAETEQAEEELAKQINAKGLQDNILMYGAVDGEEKYKLFQENAIFLFPSHFENSPVVLKEALAARQVIVCSDIEANKNVLETANQEYVLYHSVNDVIDIADKTIKAKELFESSEFSMEGIECPAHATALHALEKLNGVYRILAS